MLTVKNSRHKNQSLKSSLKIQLVLNFMNLGIFVARKADTPHDSAKRTAEYYIF